MSRSGRCYELAAKAVMGGKAGELADVDAELELVHGWPIFQGPGEYNGRHYGHAWVEWDEVSEHIPLVTRMAWDPFTQRRLPVALFYYFGRIDADRVKVYDLTHTAMMMVDEEHWGPWHVSPYDDTVFADGEE